MTEQSVYAKYSKEDLGKALIRIDVAFQSLRIFIVPSEEMNKRHLDRRIRLVQDALDSVEVHRMGRE